MTGRRGSLDLPAGFVLNSPAQPEAISRAERDLAVQFPRSYRAFLLASNGGEGPLGQESFLVIWPVEDVAEHNRGYRPDPAYALDLVFIGTDGGNEVFAFRRRDGVFVAAPLIGMAPEQVEERGNDLGAFISSFTPAN